MFEPCFLINCFLIQGLSKKKLQMNPNTSQGGAGGCGGGVVHCKQRNQSVMFSSITKRRLKHDMAPKMTQTEYKSQKRTNTSCSTKSQTALIRHVKSCRQFLSPSVWHIADRELCLHIAKAYMSTEVLFFAIPTPGSMQSDGNYCYEKNDIG